MNCLTTNQDVARIASVKTALTLLLALAAILAYASPSSARQAEPPASLAVQPGDTWAALALRFGVAAEALRALNPHMNTQRQPAIGATLTLPAGAVERPGGLVRPNEGGLLHTAARAGLSPWALARLNGLSSPYRPTFYRPLYRPGEGVIRDLPAGFASLEVSHAPAAPGRALGLRGVWARQPGAGQSATVSARLGTLPVVTASAGERFVGVVGTGAFFGGGEPELLLRVGDGPVWAQPWLFVDREWEYQELTLTGEAAEIDQAARDEERARLRELWTTVTPEPRWTAAFQTPITDVIQVSANYGARRSYNGGPYLTYHEGVDFSAYGGTPVLAPAAGTVALAEQLYVRGGAVIIDHGLGIYTGYYHLSAVHATPGQAVEPGDLLGEVGTTGLSTGNHLHWDLLINGVWVDAAAWQAEGMACWLLEGMGRRCGESEP
ncbi:peptidoglycan DD-metalloendopeptidase family protein [Promineifilum sp.]|uniref:peptidoglycan DD-metalloendopeptidase family protein n=1 Tax=Promineifilum sp. TaxID=2664178 RepID=UPI0035AD971C